jgi:NitT/TauT family transport system substrate-binding protein
MTTPGPTRGRGWVLALLVLGLLAAACGGGGGSGATAGQTPAGDTEGAAEDAGGDGTEAGADDTAAGEGEQLGSLTLGLVVSKTFELTMPARIGEDLGYFEEEGVDLEIVAFQGGADLVKGIVSGAAQIGSATGFDPAAAVAKDVPMQAFAGVAEQSPMVVIAGPDSAIAGPEDLCGKDVGITRFGSLTDFVTRVIAQQEGCPGDVTQVALGGSPPEHVAALSRGETDAFVHSTEVGIEAEATGNGRIVARFAEILPEDQYGVLMAPPDYLEQNRELVEAFLRAWFRTVAWMKDDANLEEGVAKTAEFLELDEEVARETYETLAPRLSDDGTMDTDALENLASFLPELEIADRVPELDEFHTDEFVPVEAGA